MSHDRTLDFQKAAGHGPRRFSAVAVFDRAREVRPDAIRAAAARLMSAVEGIELATLDVLVGVSWPALDGHRAEVEIRTRHDGELAPGLMAPDPRAPSLKIDTQADILVQVAAETESDRLFALRLARAVLAPELVLRDEWLGARRGLGREPFGYRDGLSGSAEYGDGRQLELSLIDDGAAAGGGWLLYQRFSQELESFLSLDERARDAVIGMSPGGGDPRCEPGGRPGHVLMARAYREEGLGWFVRRGFPYRERGEEGLCFLALCAKLTPFADAHAAMCPSDTSAGDPLLDFIRARDGGIYFVPPSAEWLASGVRPIEVPDVARPLLRRAPLLLAELAPGALAYAMLARRHGAFPGELGNEEIAPDLMPLVEELHRRIAQLSEFGADQAFAELEEGLRQALRQANAANQEAGEYVTLEP